MLNDLPLPAIQLDSQTRILHANSLADELFCCPDLHSQSLCFTDFISSDEVPSFDTFYSNIQPRTPVIYNTTLCLDESVTKPVSIKASATDEGNRIFLLNRQESWKTGCGEPCRHADILEAQYENNPGGILLVSTEMEMLSFNREFVRIWGIPPEIEASRDEEASLQSVLSKLVEPDKFLAKVQYLYNNMHKVSRDEVYLTDGRCLYRHTYPIYSKGACLGRVWYFLDITELKKAQERLSFFAYHDNLTGLPNRRLFHDLLEQTLKQAQRSNTHVGVFFLDLDNFKTVNDTYGHHVGDKLLCDVVAALKECLRDSDILCRWGGDEFVIGLPSSKRQEDVINVAEKIRAMVLRRVYEYDRELRMSLSIGIALFPTHGDNPDRLIRDADVAMYIAKRRGKNRCELFPSST